MSEKLINFLRTGKDWSRFKTSITGVFILRLPPFRSLPARLAIELNPADEMGTPKKKRGLVIRTATELDDFNNIFQYEKLAKLIRMLDEVNPRVEVARKSKGEDIIEI